MLGIIYENKIDASIFIWMIFLCCRCVRFSNEIEPSNLDVLMLTEKKMYV